MSPYQTPAAWCRNVGARPKIDSVEVSLGGNTASVALIESIDDATGSVSVTDDGVTLPWERMVEGMRVRLVRGSPDGKASASR